MSSDFEALAGGDDTEWWEGVLEKEAFLRRKVIEPELPSADFAERAIRAAKKKKREEQ